MIIDAAFAILLLFAIWHGFRKGLVASLVALIGVIVALVAAVKLSQVAALYIRQAIEVDSRYMPLIALVTVFIAVMLLLRLGSGLIEGLFKTLQLNFINQAAGALVWGAILTMCFSVALWYLYKMELFTQQTISGSVTFATLIEIAPIVLGSLGQVMPFLEEAFTWLETFFDGLAEMAQPDA